MHIYEEYIWNVPIWGLFLCLLLEYLYTKHVIRAMRIGEHSKEMKFKYLTQLEYPIFPTVEGQFCLPFAVMICKYCMDHMNILYGF